MSILSRIPQEERTKIIEAVKNIDKNIYKTATIEKDIRYLFEIWNQYVQPSRPQNINCKGCRTNVFSKYKHYIRQWKEWSEQEASL